MLMVPQKGNLEAAFDQSLGDQQNYAASSGMVMIIVRPGMEQNARDSLRRRGIGAWWPNFKKETQAKDRISGERYTKIVLAGIIPGIVLTPSRLNAHFWASIDLAPGAINVARDLRGDPIVIDDTDVVLLHKIEAALNKATPEKVVHSFKEGDDVVLFGDLDRRIPAKVEKVRKNGHVELEVTFMGGLRRMTVTPDQIAHV